MSSEIADTWLVGVVAHDDALSSVRVHAGYVASGPTSGRDHRVQIRMRFDGSDESGFPDDETAKTLIEREESLADALGEVAVLVGVLTVPGFRDLVFHTDDPEGSTNALGGVDVIDVPADVDITADPGWSLYRSLFTDAVPADGDRRKIHEIAGTSGVSAPECRVEHRFVFLSLADADQAAAALRDAGLEVTFVAADDVAEAARPRFVLTDTEILTQVDMARSRDALNGFAVSWGGTYEGWAILDP